MRKMESRGTVDTAAESSEFNFSSACSIIDRLKGGTKNEKQKSVLDRIFNMDFSKASSTSPVKRSDAKPD